MELLVATLISLAPEREDDTIARIRLLSEAVNNAPGLVNSRLYRSHGAGSYYCFLTTWESEEQWWRVQERYNPKQLLLSSATELLTAAPTQWYLAYLWGYIRPSASPLVAAAHLATIRSEQADLAQRGWIEGLRRQSVNSLLAYGFLARGGHEEAFPANTSLRAAQEGGHLRMTTFLNLLSWPNESDRDEFYADVHYQAIHRFLNSVGTVQIFPLEPV